MEEFNLSFSNLFSPKPVHPDIPYDFIKYVSELMKLIKNDEHSLNERDKNFVNRNRCI